MSPLRRLLAAQIPADFADLLDLVAISALLTYDWHTRPVVFAWLAVAMALPYLVIGPVAGAMVDRVDTRRVLVLSNLGRGLASATMVFAPDWPTLMILITLRSSADSFFTPAKQTALQHFAPGDLAVRANGASHAISQSSKIVAPSLGGLALIFLAPSHVFLITAAISVLAAVMLSRLDPLPRPAPSDQPRGLMAELRGGWEEV
ncbi:MAG: MFS transporter, partial [bacterium]